LIGFDRPLRPKWIYKTLKMVEIGEKPILYNKPFEDIAVELIGKEGKRKARTILFRSFIYSFQSKKTKIETNPILELAQTKTFEQLKPIFLVKLLMDYEITRFVTDKLELLIDSSNEISMPLLSKRMVTEYGDRDVVKRSIRSFMATLCHFNVLCEVNKKTFKLTKKIKVEEETLVDILKLYSTYFLKSKVVDLQHIPSQLLFYFEMPALEDVAFAFNGVHWEYIKDVRRSVLMMK
jgi:hypothetical protein